MIYLSFSIAAIITILSAVKLSTYADVIENKTSLGGMLIGTLLLAGATSLPEVTTSLTAVAVGNPNIGVSNVLGSNLFNLLILACFDLYYRKKRILSSGDTSHLYTLYLGLLFTIFIGLAMVSPLHFSFFNIGIEMYALIIFYSLGLYVLSKSESDAPTNKTKEPDSETVQVLVEKNAAISLKRAQIGFAIAAIIILVSGTVLTISGDAIAQATGLGSSFVGTFLIAGATSLPEVVTVLIAIQLANYNLAIGNILGSNLFNLLILILMDIFYQDGAILKSVHEVTLLTVSAALLLTIVFIVALTFFKNKKMTISPKIYILPSLFIIVIYLISSYFIFTNGAAL